MSLDSQIYNGPSGIRWFGNPSKLEKNDRNSVFAFFNGPAYAQKSPDDCVIEVWKKTEKNILGFVYQKSVDVVAVFRVKLKTIKQP